MSARSYLYVPGDQPDKVEGAGTRGADALILDLEDSVSADRKDAARSIVGDWLREHRSRESDSPEAWVRVNSESIDEDLEAVVTPGLTGVVVGKADQSSLRQIASTIGDMERDNDLPEDSLQVTALVESAAELLDLRRLAEMDRVTRIGLGEVDLAAELNLDLSADAAEIMPIRLLVVVVSAAVGLRAPVGPVWTAIQDEDGLRRSTQALRRLGYAGRAAVHPAQIPVINEVFSPSEKEVAEARATLRRYEEAMEAGSAVTTDASGGMIDTAVVRRARTILKQAGIEMDE